MQLFNRERLERVRDHFDISEVFEINEFKIAGLA